MLAFPPKWENKELSQLIVLVSNQRIPKIVIFLEFKILHLSCIINALYLNLQYYTRKENLLKLHLPFTVHYKCINKNRLSK